jgi:hypothetical protein
MRSFVAYGVLIWEFWFNFLGWFWSCICLSLFCLFVFFPVAVFADRPCFWPFSGLGWFCKGNSCKGPASLAKAKACC